MKNRQQSEPKAQIPTTLPLQPPSPPPLRLEDLSARERLAGLGVKERLEGLSPGERIELLLLLLREVQRLPRHESAMIRRMVDEALK